MPNRIFIHHDNIHSYLASTPVVDLRSNDYNNNNDNNNYYDEDSDDNDNDDEYDMRGALSPILSQLATCSTDEMAADADMLMAMAQQQLEQQTRVAKFVFRVNESVYLNEINIVKSSHEYRLSVHVVEALDENQSKVTSVHFSSRHLINSIKKSFNVTC